MSSQAKLVERLAAFGLLTLAAWSGPVVTEVLGRPTDRSITLNARADADLESYFEYGPEPGSYGAQTTVARMPAGVPAEFLMDGLDPDRRYYYRMRYRAAGSTAEFEAGGEHSFQTQRARGGTFTFCLQGDSHPERVGKMFGAELYTQTLQAVAAERPDFYLTMGDDFSVDTLNKVSAETVEERYLLQLPYLSVVGQSSPLFLVNGNHEQAARYLLDGTPDNVAVWAQNARNKYYPQPAPDGFYTGNAEEVPHIGLLRNYFAWEWGDALFVTIDPYWSSPVPVDNVFGNNAKGPGSDGKTANKWDITHGDAQYQWLKRTLEQSKAKWKFVFAHHPLGTGRGGIGAATMFEWGGQNQNGSWGFDKNRPDWPMPIHQLMAANGVTVFFQGHDHLFAREQMDGVVYQELPCPADDTYSMPNADAYPTGDLFPNAGYVRVTVSPDRVLVEYIRMFLPADERPPEKASGMVQYSYSIGEGGAVSVQVSRQTEGGKGELSANRKSRRRK